MEDSRITLTIGKQKNIALIAHDGKKAEMIEWCAKHKELLSQHFLCGTGTTARMITERDRTSGKGVQQRPSGRRPADRCEGCGGTGGSDYFLLRSSDGTAA